MEYASQSELWDSFDAHRLINGIKGWRDAAIFLSGNQDFWKDDDSEVIKQQMLEAAKLKQQKQAQIQAAAQLEQQKQAQKQTAAQLEQQKREKDWSEIDFSDNGDGTIRDNKSGLVWQKIVDVQLRNWDEALSYCQNLALAGHSDWKLPDKDTLISLWNKTKPDEMKEKVFKATLNSRYFPNMDGFYWSSTIDGELTPYAYIFNFTPIGNVSYSKKEKHDHNRVRCVRLVSHINRQR